MFKGRTVREVLVAGVAMAAWCGVALGADAALPAGAKAVWNLKKAYRETTPTQETVCINGLWKFQPVEGTLGEVPSDNWGWLKVPGPWPDYNANPWMAEESQTATANPAWKTKGLKAVTMAWYQREIETPSSWAGRRVILRADYVNTYAGVYIDGQKAGEIISPGGETEITKGIKAGTKQVLSILAATIPPAGGDVKAFEKRGDITGYAAQAADKRGSVGPYRGLVGDVYIASMPSGSRIEDVKVNTSVQKWEIEIDAAVSGLKDDESYTITAEAMDGTTKAKELKSEAFKGIDAKNGRVKFTNAWHAEKLWDTITPGNQYEMKVTLRDAKGKALDESRPVRFGFREFRIDGKDFRLNGTRVYWMAMPLDNGVMSPAEASYTWARETFRRMKKLGVNMMYTHNYGCGAGNLAYQDILRAADDEGMMVSFSLPNCFAYEWPYAKPGEESAKTNGMPQDVTYYVKQAGNHPSVVVYSTSHNGFGYAQDQNPDQIDGKGKREGRWADYGRLVETVVHESDTTRPIYHHAGGNFEQMFTLNCYLDFVPVQERADWFEHWSKEGVKPLFLNEYGTPFQENWCNHREGYGYFGWTFLMEFLFPEWGAQYNGEAAYKLNDQEIADIKFEGSQWRKQQGYHKSAYPFDAYKVTSQNMSGVQAKYIERTWPAFRTLGVSGWNFWGGEMSWVLKAGATPTTPQPVTDWENLQRPGYSPDFAKLVTPSIEVAYKESDWEPGPAAAAFVKYNNPVLMYIAGKAGKVTSQDHNFAPGETVEKQVIVLNNSRKAVTAECSWRLLTEGASGFTRTVTVNASAKTVTVETGEKEVIPVSFTLPADMKAGHYEITATAKLSTGETQKDVFGIDVVAKAATPTMAGKVALFDPAGDTAKMLTGLGVKFENVKADTKLAGYDVLIVGKNALTPYGPGPDVKGIANGLKVLVFEQGKETLEKRLGFRVQEYVLRDTFARVSDHPALAGLTTENLHDWRGEGTTVAPRLDALRTGGADFPHDIWAGNWNFHAWRCGCQGSVASLLMEKPARGDYLPLVDGGFSLQFAPLMEYREGKGLVMFCQMDVTGRTEADPAAERLVKNVLGYVGSYKAGARRSAVYAGSAECKAHLEASGFTLGDYKGGALKAEQVLVVGPGGGKTLAGETAAIGKWLKAGGNLLGVGLGQEDVDALGVKVTMKKAEHIAAYFGPQSASGPFAGVSAADVYIRDPRELEMASEGAEGLGDGVIAKAKDGNVVLTALRPWEFDYKKANGSAWTFSSRSHNVKWTFQRSSFALTRLLTNMGVESATPTVKRLTEPAVDTGWLQDLKDGAWLQAGTEQFVLSTRWKGQVTVNAHSVAATGWEKPEFDDSAWRDLRVPGLFQERYPDIGWYQGLFIARLKFQLPKEWAAKQEVTITLGYMGEDATYLNGTLVGTTTEKATGGNPDRVLRVYKIPAGALKEGENVLAFATSNWGPPGLKPAETPLQGQRLADPTKHVNPEGVRYLSGLYADTPEWMDDVYRYLRW